MERVVDPDLCAAAVADLYSTVFNGPEPVDAAPDSASGILHTLGELRRLSLPQATPEGRRRLQHQRRQEVQQREAERRKQHADAAQRKQFIHSLLNAGPDVAEAAVDPNAPDRHRTTHKRAFKQPKEKISIDFGDTNPLLRCKVPRKTRQALVDKFCRDCEHFFPTAIVSAHRVELLALEREIFEQSASRASYMGHWMNVLAKLDSCASLEDVFHKPEPTSTVENPPTDSEPVDKAAAECPQEQLQVSLFGSPLGPEEEKEEKEEEKTTSSLVNEKNSSLIVGSDKVPKPTLSSSGKPMLAGAELPISLFGSPLGTEVEQAATMATPSISRPSGPTTDIGQNEAISPANEQPTSMPETPCNEDPSAPSTPTNENDPAPSFSSKAISGAPKGFRICRDYVAKVIKTRLDPLCKFKVVERDVAVLISKKCLNKVLGIQEGPESRLAAWTRWENPAKLKKLQKQRTSIEKLVDKYVDHQQKSRKRRRQSQGSSTTSEQNESSKKIAKTISNI